MTEVGDQIDPIRVYHIQFSCIHSTTLGDMCFSVSMSTFISWLWKNSLVLLFKSSFRQPEQTGDTHSQLLDTGSSCRPCSWDLGPQESGCAAGQPPDHTSGWLSRLHATAGREPLSLPFRALAFFLWAPAIIGRWELQGSEGKIPTNYFINRSR